MENKGLLFIPDISGFTKFVNEMEIDHSRLIIQELLEVLINSNQMGLELSEIEGDAILFYKFGELPDLKDIYRQVEKMFVEFHKSIIAYDNRRFCQCKACSSAIDLSLKVISHYGEFTGITVKEFKKLFGKDVIIAHRLLKNDIEQHEYWLVTKNLQNDTPPDFAQWMMWNSSAKKTESGDVPYYYTQIGELKKEITPEPLPKLDLDKKPKVMSFTKEFNTDILTLFHASGDFNFRSKWQEGVKSVEEVSHFLPRIGMKCKCQMENGKDVIYTVSYSYTPERIEFSEKDETQNTISYYTLEKLNENKSRLTLDFYLDKNLFGEFKYNLFRKKKDETAFKKSLENLEGLISSNKVY